MISQIKAVWRKMTASKFSLDCIPYIKGKTTAQTPNSTVLLCRDLQMLPDNLWKQHQGVHPSMIGQGLARGQGM